MGYSLTFRTTRCTNLQRCACCPFACYCSFCLLKLAFLVQNNRFKCSKAFYTCRSGSAPQTNQIASCTTSLSPSTLLLAFCQSQASLHLSSHLTRKHRACKVLPKLQPDTWLPATASSCSKTLDLTVT